jgi:hypothetical protein
MIFSIRKTKTASRAIAVQVVRYKNRKVEVIKHIGSGHSPEEIAALMVSAAIWIEQETHQNSLFQRTAKRTLPLATTRYLGTTHIFAYSVLRSAAERCGFSALENSLLIDLVLMRLVEPTSKTRSLKLLSRYFNIQYAERSVYRALPKMKEYKTDAERIAVSFAKDSLQSNLVVILYDVTTLYFETFMKDELRIQGFSKDNKSQQPQIIIGLLVTTTGFPVGYEVFRGNTFEGKTMLPVLERFVERYGVTTPIVVADAAMLSYSNIVELKNRGLSYIVGARLANTSGSTIDKVSSVLRRKDGATIRIRTECGDLICSFSANRFRKDRADMERQIERGKMLIARGEPGKRAKFIKCANKKGGYFIDDALIKKTELLLGIKGYYTNTPSKRLSNRRVIACYHDLWHVEQAFRIAKSDLAARPIFHYKQDAILAHMVICFIALAIGKYLEIKTKLSLRRVIDILWTVTDARITDSATGEEFVFRSEPDKEVKTLLKKLRLSY